MGFLSDLVEVVGTTLGNLNDAGRVHPALVASVQHYQAQGYMVHYFSENSATLTKAGMIWDSTITLQVGPDGRVHER